MGCVRYSYCCHQISFVHACLYSKAGTAVVTDRTSVNIQIELRISDLQRAVADVAVPLSSTPSPANVCSARYSTDTDVGRQFFSCLQWECEPGHYSESMPNCYHDFLEPLSDDFREEESDVEECSNDTCCEIDGQIGCPGHHSVLASRNWYDVCH